MSDSVTHVLLTRFNLPSRGHESLVRARENWLRDRVGLFERFCLPSVLAQSTREFSWLIYFDPQSPPWLVEWLRDHDARGHFTPLLREEVPRAELLADLRTAAGTRAGHGELLTTNLDNDDSLARDFVARVQEAATAGARTAVYVGDGLVVRDQQVYRRFDPHNAFCSVRESWDDPVTCWSDWHNLLPRHMPALVLRGAPGWLQVIHGTNVSNRVRGRRTRPSLDRDLFPGLLDDIADPTRTEVTRDVVVETPLRALRESGRTALKTVVGAALGRDGLDRMKMLWASARRRVGPARSTTAGPPSRKGRT